MLCSISTASPREFRLVVNEEKKKSDMIKSGEYLLAFKILQQLPCALFVLSGKRRCACGSRNGRPKSRAVKAAEGHG